MRFRYKEVEILKSKRILCKLHTYSNSMNVYIYFVLNTLLLLFLRINRNDNKGITQHFNLFHIRSIINTYNYIL